MTCVVVFALCFAACVSVGVGCFVVRRFVGVGAVFGTPFVFVLGAPIVEGCASRSFGGPSQSARATRLARSSTRGLPAARGLEARLACGFLLRRLVPSGPPFPRCGSAAAGRCRLPFQAFPDRAAASTLYRAMASVGLTSFSSCPPFLVSGGVHLYIHIYIYMYKHKNTTLVIAKRPRQRFAMPM